MSLGFKLHGCEAKPLKSDVQLQLEGFSSEPQETPHLQTVKGIARKT